MLDVVTPTSAQFALVYLVRSYANIYTQPLSAFIGIVMPFVKQDNTALFPEQQSGPFVVPILALSMVHGAIQFFQRCVLPV